MSRARAFRRAALLAQVLVGLSVARAVPAQVVLQETRSEYVLDAADSTGLRRQLAQRLAQREAEGGVISHGLTRAQLEMRYELEPLERAGCRLARIEVSLAIDTQLPVWRPRAQPAPRLASRVARMLAGLARHEAGHRASTLDAAAAIDAGLRGLAPAADCKALRRAAQRLVSRALERLRVQEWFYDQATGRGRSQGAVLELDGDERPRRSAPRR
jgi:predicted secreted Zn-dependent protease